MVNYSDKPQLAQDLNESNDCFVRALAISANISYNEAHGIAEELFNRKTGEGTQNVESIIRSKEGRNYFAHRGIELEDVNHTYINKRDKKVYPRNIRGFYNRYKNGTFLVLVRKHALVIKDGIVMDWPIQSKKIGRTVEAAYRVKNNRQLSIFA
jgi:hypothetical protein